MPVKLKLREKPVMFKQKMIDAGTHKVCVCVCVCVHTHARVCVCMHVSKCDANTCVHTSYKLTDKYTRTICKRVHTQQ